MIDILRSWLGEPAGTGVSLAIDVLQTRFPAVAAPDCVPIESTLQHQGVCIPVNLAEKSLSLAD